MRMQPNFSAESLEVGFMPEAQERGPQLDLSENCSLTKLQRHQTRVSAAGHVDSGGCTDIASNVETPAL